MLAVKQDNNFLPRLDLPSEILLHVFSFLPARDLCSCGRVAKQWNSLFTDESLVSAPTSGRRVGGVVERSGIVRVGLSACIIDGVRMSSCERSVWYGVTSFEA